MILSTVVEYFFSCIMATNTVLLDWLDPLGPAQWIFQWKSSYVTKTDWLMKFYKYLTRETCRICNQKALQGDK